MVIYCVWEHNGNDTLLYSINYTGAFTRGASKDIALQKMKREVISYLRCTGEDIPDKLSIEIVEEKESSLQICDADTEVIFNSEKMLLSKDEYVLLKGLALKSASDFERLYVQIPDKDKSVLSPRKTFYDRTPVTAREMYDHTKCVNLYYFGEIRIKSDTDGSIYECRKRGFEALEKEAGYLDNKVFYGKFDEYWSLGKVIRRFIWNDRIHAKGMYRMAKKTFPEAYIDNVFMFDI